MSYTNPYFLSQNKRKDFALLLFITSLTIIATKVNYMAAEDGEEDDDEVTDLTKALGWGAIGSLVFASFYIFLYKTFRLTRKISDESKLNSLKDNYVKIFLKIKKPFQYLHYLSGFIALILFIIHGIYLNNGDSTTVVIGWISCGIYIFYILTGIFLWLRIKPFWSNKIIRKGLTFLHNNLILLIVIVVIHLIHVLISED